MRTQAKSTYRISEITDKAIIQNVRLLGCVNKGYKDGLQPETLADGNWLVKQNQPVSKTETKSDTNLRGLFES